ncbi:MAG: 30S ribosomal protein S4 [SAR202 cluster bacterium]|nr:30S ribosomal protein S4 [SAR202 cluster bacterium]
MARYTGPVCRLCRRAGEKMFLKAERCFTPKCAVDRRRKAPGAAVARRRRASDWGTQLREKQKARQIYGILERQFRNYFEEARRKPGVTGTHLMQLLERRLDNVAFRAGFGNDRSQARQWVNHGHITVNGRKVDVPSYRVRAGDVIGWKAGSKQRPFFQDLAKGAGKHSVPDWLELDKANMTARVIRNPESRDVDAPLEVRYIVEHYSR